MTSLRIAFGLALSACLLATAAAAGPLHRLPLARLPAQVQHDLLAHDIICGVPRKVAYEAQSAAAGPIGGPGRLDYFAEETDAYFQPPRGAAYAYGGEACVANYVPGRFWMQRREGGYKAIVFPYAQLYWGAQGFVVATPDLDCDAAVWRRVVGGWSDCEHFVKWDRRTERFRPITQDMLFEETLAWAKARGYRRVGE